MLKIYKTKKKKNPTLLQEANSFYNNPGFQGFRNDEKDKNNNYDDNNDEDDDNYDEDDSPDWHFPSQHWKLVP